MTPPTTDNKHNHILMQRKVLTPQMEDIFTTHHPEVAVAHCLNAIVGLGKDPNTIGIVVRWDIYRKLWQACDGRTNSHLETRDDFFVLSITEEFLFRAMEEIMKDARKDLPKHTVIRRLYKAQSRKCQKNAIQLFKLLVAVGDDTVDIPTKGSEVLV